MPGVLIASDKQYHETLRTFFAAGQPAQCCANAGEARRAMCGGSFETLVINAPLPDEFGRELAVQAADNGMDSILLCPGPQADKLAAGLEKYGVFVLAKPLSRQQTAFALRLIQTGRQRLQKLTAQNRRLTKRLDEARIISQAKCALALCRGLRGTGSPADRKRSHGQPHLQPGSRTGDHAKAGGRRPFITAFSFCNR